MIDIFSKYAWVISFKDKICITITNYFQKVLNESRSKPKKKWEHKDREFFYRSMKWSSQDNNIEKYSTHNEGKSVVTDTFIRTL